MLWFDLLAIPRDAPHLANAHLFINYLMDPHVIANISNAIGYANANLAATALLDPSIAADPAIYPTTDQMRRLVVQVSYRLNRCGPLRAYGRSSKPASSLRQNGEGDSDLYVRAEIATAEFAAKCKPTSSSMIFTTLPALTASSTSVSRQFVGNGTNCDLLLCHDSAPAVTIVSGTICKAIEGG